MTEHECKTPDIESYPDRDEDWQCPVCEQWWFVGTKNYCHSCMRGDGPVWERYGTGDGSFPLVTAPRGGIVFGTDP